MGRTPHPSVATTSPHVRHVPRARARGRWGGWGEVGWGWGNWGAGCVVRRQGEVALEGDLAECRQRRCEESPPKDSIALMALSRNASSPSVRTLMRPALPPEVIAQT